MLGASTALVDMENPPSERKLNLANVLQKERLKKKEIRTIASTDLFRKIFSWLRYILQEV